MSYALQVTPARESFGALIRGAQWLGNGPAPKTQLSSLAAEIPSVPAKRIIVQAENPPPEPQSEPPTPEPPEEPLSKAIPDGADDTEAQVIAEHEILMSVR